MNINQDQKDFIDYLEKSRLDPDGKSDIIWKGEPAQFDEPVDRARDLKKRRKKLRQKK